MAARANRKHKWAFRARFRARAYGWRSQPAVKRVTEAVSEIRKASRTDPVLGAEGAVLFLERVSPALEQVDSSSGAIGTAVNNAVDALVPIISGAPAGDETREGWIERLWQAFLDDEIPYIERLADSWGELCASPERASRQADELLPDLRAAWADPRPGAYFRGTTACLSCLLAAGRHRELLDLLEQAPFVWWHNRVYGVRALAAMGRTDEALDYAGASLGRSDSPAAMARTCEEILLEAGRRDEAYQRYALQATRRSSRLATFRAIATTYPDRDKEGILNDLIRSTPGEEEKWFATARHLGLHDLAVVLANRSPCDPRTLNRAARDHLADHPRFALEVSLAALRWLAEGWGYEITSADIHAARACAVEAAEALGESDRTLARIREAVASEGPPAVFVRRILGLDPGPG